MFSRGIYPVIMPVRRLEEQRLPAGSVASQLSGFEIFCQILISNRDMFEFLASGVPSVGAYVGDPVSINDCPHKLPGERTKFDTKFNTP